MQRKNKWGSDSNWHRSQPAHHSGCLAHLHQLANGRVLPLGVGRSLQNNRSCLNAPFTQRRRKAGHEHVPKPGGGGRDSGGFHGVQFTAMLKLLAWNGRHRYLACVTSISHEVGFSPRSVSEGSYK